MSRKYEFVANVGITVVALEESLSTAYSALVEDGNESVYDEPSLELECSSLKALFQSLKQQPSKIYQIISESDQIIYKNEYRWTTIGRCT